MNSQAAEIRSLELDKELLATKISKRNKIIIVQGAVIIFILLIAGLCIYLKIKGASIISIFKSKLGG